jgi:hypothetical protein
MIELETYCVECPHCKEEVDFTINQVDGLSADIDDKNETSAANARAETEREYEGMVDPSDLPIQPRTIHDLSAAIRRGDRAEAELLLDRIVEDLSLDHSEACQIGRYSSQARAA